MALDPKYINISDLQSLFRDKDTGLPLSQGYIEFYKDNARTIPKDVFILSGSPPDYSYTNIGNVVDLNAIGTESYNSNDVTIFFYPYDTNGDIELYFAQIYNQDGVFQFSRQGLPYITDEGTSQTDFTNYIPNGQFLYHNDLPETFIGTIYQPGEVRSTVTDIAQGGWYFVRTNNSSTDFVLFDRFNDITNNPTSNPRYATRVKCEDVGSGNTVKDLRIKFSNVNKFASEVQKYTFSFSGLSNTGSNLSIDIFLIKNYGTNGSSETQEQIGQVVITNSYNIVQISFLFGTNDDKTLGTLNDDYVEIACRFPTNVEFDASVTDFILTPGEVDIDNFPETTDADMKTRGIAGFMPTPNPDGSDLYLPLVLTLQGMKFDDSLIGSLLWSFDATPPISYLQLDGAKYEYDGYSSDLIPYARLGAKLLASGTPDINGGSTPVMGTGNDFATAVLTPSFASFRIANNAIGVVSDTADGATATGFTFSVVHTGVALASQYYVDSYYQANNIGYIINKNVGPVTSINAGTSGFIVGVAQFGDSTLPQISAYTVVSFATLAGKYFTFSSYNSGNVPFYVWFTVDGAGADPAPGGTGILVAIRSTDSDAITCQKIMEALKGAQVSLIGTVAASSIPAGAYFLFNATGANYYVWYTKDGVGIDPEVVGRIGIKVDILTADTAIQVAKKSQLAINKKYFQIVDAKSKELFFRTFDGNPEEVRLSGVPGITQAYMSTYQFSTNLHHRHTIYGIVAGGGAASGPNVDFPPDEAESGFQGSLESKPNNLTVNVFIKY